jgi:hypothetical protein
MSHGCLLDALPNWRNVNRIFTLNQRHGSEQLRYHINMVNEQLKRCAAPPGRSDHQTVGIVVAAAAI